MSSATILILTLTFGLRLGQEVGKRFRVRAVEPGIFEFVCRRCKRRFETDTTATELLAHKEN